MIFLLPRDASINHAFALFVYRYQKEKIEESLYKAMNVANLGTAVAGILIFWIFVFPHILIFLLQYVEANII